jgi:hypothetical protein
LVTPPRNVDEKNVGKPPKKCCWKNIGNTFEKCWWKNIGKLPKNVDEKKCW